MFFLTAIGVPPDMSMWLMGPMFVQVRVMVSAVNARYLQRVQRERLLSMSPGDQYRYHLMAGGYRP